jgi:hypothetical protein
MNAIGADQDVGAHGGQRRAALAVDA